MVDLGAEDESSKLGVEVCDVRSGVGVSDPYPSWWWITSQHIG